MKKMNPKTYFASKISVIKIVKNPIFFKSVVTSAKQASVIEELNALGKDIRVFPKHTEKHAGRIEMKTIS